MKKFLSIVLALFLVLSIGFVMSACGDDAATDTDAQATESTENKDSTDMTAKDFLPEALKNATAYEIADVSLTGWQLAGGMIDGVEMEQADLDSLNSTAGGYIQYVFADDKKVQMVTPLNSLEGTYTIESENPIVHMVFPEIEYYGIFTVVGEQTVFMIADPKQPGSALYLTQVEEG